MLNSFLNSCNRTIVGNEFNLKLSLASIISEGSILIEDYPGTGKTTFAKTLTNNLGLDFKRIQFTSDLLPSDILGYNFFKGNEQVFQKGPIFTNVVFADELNRYRNEHNNSGIKWIIFKFFAMITVFFTTFIIVPIYLMAKIINLIFPILCILFVYGHGMLSLDYNNSMQKMDNFQWTMFSAYCILFSFWCIMFCIVFKEEYYMRHVLPQWNMLNLYFFKIYAIKPKPKPSNQNENINTNATTKNEIAIESNNTPNDNYNDDIYNNGYNIK